MEEVKITKEIIEKAKIYMPLAYKEKFISDFSTDCIDKINIVSDMTLETVPYYKDNTSKKSIYLMGALIGFYLGIEKMSDFVGEESYEMYDKYASSHIFNQVERLKQDQSIRDKIFDILYDYKDLEKRFNSEVYAMVQTMNDPVGRVIEKISSDVTPEAMQEGLKQLEELEKQFHSEKKKKVGE